MPVAATLQAFVENEAVMIFPLLAANVVAPVGGVVGRSPVVDLDLPAAEQVPEIPFGIIGSFPRATVVDVIVLFFLRFGVVGNFTVPVAAELESFPNSEAEVGAPASGFDPSDPIAVVVAGSPLTNLCLVALPKIDEIGVTFFFI